MGLRSTATPRRRRAPRPRLRALDALDALEAGDGRAAFVLDALVATRDLTTIGIAEHVAPNVLSLTHWDRLLDGELYASSSRLDWRSVSSRS